MLRRVLRWTMRGVKAVLALIALAALVLWPWGYPSGGRIEGQYWTAGSDRAGLTSLLAGCEQGRIGLAWLTRGFTQERPDPGWERAGLTRPGWTWACGPYSEYWETLRGVDTLGPVRWHFSDGARPGRTAVLRIVSLPCWLLALTASAWPLASALLWLRRRRRARRDAAAGRCRHCGYDLRATPSPGGALLGRCPECGRPSENPAASERSIPT